MKIISEITYFAPTTIEEAVELLQKHPENSCLLAGGTDVVPALKKQVEKPRVIIDLKKISGRIRNIELKTIENIESIESIERIESIESKNQQELFIGTLVTFCDLLDSALIRENYPLIWEMSKVVASVGIRNRATIVGNICSAVPCMDSGPVLLTYDAKVQTNKRIIPIENFWIGPRQNCLSIDEIVLGITIISTSPKSHVSAGRFVKLMRYRGEDLAQASIAILINSFESAATATAEVKIAFGAVAPVPIRAYAIEKIISKQINQWDEWNEWDQMMEEALATIPDIIAPISDLRASAEYRLHMVGVMFKRGLKDAILRLQGNGSKYGSSLI
ncbi:MAG: FAD binding domain-containing protein [Oligoflexia bacterium]|nr:FAD binding domain-containing protein [Oligoflexia bacterium]